MYPKTILEMIRLQSEKSPDAIAILGLENHPIHLSAGYTSISTNPSVL